MKKITKDMNIEKAIEENENVSKVLFEAGIGCLGCTMASSESLYDGLMSHGLSEEEIGLLIKQMNKKTK